MQLAYAAVSIGVLGLPHGASDLAIIPQRQWSGFLTLYLLCASLILVWWMVAPFTALVALLLLSAIHFGLDDVPRSRPIERLSRGILMVAAPALLHHAQLSGLFVVSTAQPENAATLTSVMAVLASVGLAMLPLVLRGYWQRGDRQGMILVAAGVLALLILPPLIGFAIGFVLLHARAQLGVRMAILGCKSVGRYLKITSPIMAGALMVIGSVGVLFAEGNAPGARTLFAGIAALAIPHMLVTPFWRVRA
ncbi:Brp/Blh family beta-carotene 15,15'-dioxygenase [Sphingomonas sp. PAMC 26617]|uniref:Brp/Blh family beta-carotene 15,15'-dioxygenase n=1 Tax=Sphingomonas sp. PAMC 26617 TaxID=1112216 RepID=UPI0012F4E700|nr:Brp/Blh family beta-carotene 15,15'-dioxygenase [Sphingomonas sp. PAMC 26617]